MAPVDADVCFDDFHGQQARVVCFEADDLGKLLPDCLRDPHCPPLVHSVAQASTPALTNFCRAGPEAYPMPATPQWLRLVPRRADWPLPLPRMEVHARRGYDRWPRLRPRRRRVATDPGDQFPQPPR